MALIKLEQFENVVANGVALLTTERLWPNTLEYIDLVLGGTALTKAMITNIKIRFGTKTVWDLSASQIESMNLFEGGPTTANYLRLNFANSRARHLEQQYFGSPDFDALGIRRVNIEVTIVGATAPTLAAWASVVGPKILSDPGLRQMFRTLYRTPLSPSGAVVKQAQPINYGQAGGALLRKLHFFSALVTLLSIKRDGLDFYEEVDSALNAANLQHNGWVPQANIFTYNAVEDDNELKALVSIRKDGQGGSLVPQQLLISTSAGGVFDAVADTFSNLNAI